MPWWQHCCADVADKEGAMLMMHREARRAVRCIIGRRCSRWSMKNRIF